MLVFALVNMMNIVIIIDSLLRMVVAVNIVNTSSLAVSSILVMPQFLPMMLVIMNMVMVDMNSVPSSIPYTLVIN